MTLLFAYNYSSGGWKNVKIYSCKIKYSTPTQFYLIIIKPNQCSHKQNEVKNYAM
jgi:hypothetical protein